ncbi:MAG: hypothetical protein AAB389_00920 [Patescibacteria group bacterium]
MNDACMWVPGIGGIGSFLKSPFGKKVFLPVMIVAAIVGAIWWGVSASRDSAIADFSTKPRNLSSTSERFLAGYSSSEKRVILCYTEYDTSVTKADGQSSIVVSEIPIYKMEFSFDGNGRYTNDDLRVITSQIFFDFDEKLTRPYVTFEGMNHRPTEDYFSLLYKNDPGVRVMIHCPRSYVPTHLCKALGLPVVNPEQLEDK